MNRDEYLSDEGIVKLYFDRDENAISQTDLKYGKLLLTVAYNCLADKESAKECQNDTYFETWNRVPPDRPMSLRAYLVKIVRCRAMNRYQQMRALKRVPSELTLSMEELDFSLHDNMSVEQICDQKYLTKVIEGYVRSLGEKRRYIFMERYYMAGSVASIAKALRLTESAVYKELGVIKLGLREHLERNDIYI